MLALISIFNIEICDNFFGGQNEKKKFPILQLYPHPAAGPETTFFLRVA